LFEIYPAQFVRSRIDKHPIFYYYLLTQTQPPSNKERTMNESVNLVEEIFVEIADAILRKYFKYEDQRRKKGVCGKPWIVEEIEKKVEEVK